MTKRTLQHLDRKHIPYNYVDIDRDRKAASWVASQNEGKEKKPTLDIGGTVLSEPSNEELDEVLRNKGFAV
jgi:hypothetical protein